VAASAKAKREADAKAKREAEASAKAKREAEAEAAAVAAAKAQHDAEPPVAEAAERTSVSSAPGGRPAPHPALVAGADESTLRLDVGLPVSWRRAEVRPDLGTGSTFRTTSPYPGINLGLQYFPARGLPTWLAYVGLAGLYTYRASSFSANGREFGSSEQRFAADVLYERAVLPGTVLSARAGYALHRFQVDEGAPLPGADRNGPRLGADVQQAVGSFQLFAGGRWYPVFGASGDEAKARGESTGSGIDLLGGVQGALPFARAAGFGWRLEYDWTRFSDTYDARGGTLSSGGSATSVYQGIMASVTWSR
jgi:hypothetical protein